MSQDEKTLQAKIDALEESIGNVRGEFLTKIRELNDELTELRKLSVEFSSDPQAHSVTHTNNEQPETSFYKSPVADAQVFVNEANKKDDSVNSNVKSALTKSIPETEKNGWHSETDKSAAQKPSKAGVENKPSEPGFINAILSNVMQTIISYILSSLTIFALPFQELYHKLINLYFHYQKQGKAPVFLMTAAGLATLTVGFGYLLQYSFNTLFNDALKAITGFIIGGGIIAAGILLSKKKTDFRDYGASVIALGVIFYYLTAYFVGPYYGIVGETTGFILLIGVTLASFSLALIFETRVVSAITLVGGIFMPFIVGDGDSAGLVFLTYLFVLSIGNLYLSYKIKWPSLSQITFALSLSVIEYIGISEAVHPFAAIVLLSLFFYMYTYYWSFEGVQLKEKLLKNELTILVANIFYFIYAILNVPTDSYIIAGVLIVHSILLSITMKVLRLMSSIVAPVYMLMIGLMVATAVFVVLPADATGIIWAIQGLAMLYIGFKYTHKMIRVEGYTIYVVAMFGILWKAIEAFALISNTTIAWHWINLVAFGILSLIAYRVINYYRDEATTVELKASVIQNEIFTFWGVVALSLVIIIYVPVAITVLAVVPILWCFYRVARHQLQFAQITGYLFFTAFILQIVMGMFDSNSMVILDQSVLSWIAIVELLCLAWGMRFYYERLNLTGWGKDIAVEINNAFYFMPLMLIALGVFSFYYIYIFDLKIHGYHLLEFNNLWFDFSIYGSLIFIAFKLNAISGDSGDNKTRKYHAEVLNETTSLFMTLFFLFTVSILFGEWVYNAAVIPMFYLLYRGLKEKLKLTEKLAWLHFALFAVMTMLSYKEKGNFHFSEQSLATMIGWVEILISAWMMQLIYERADYKKGGYKLACYVRIGVYILIPLLFLPRVLRLYEDYLPVALWVSFVISWLMFKRLKLDALLKELTILFLLAMTGSILISVSAIMGGNQLPGLVALITGVLIISVFHYVEKTLHKQKIVDSSYHKIILISPYYYGFSLASFSYAVSYQVTISLVMTGLYFLYLIQERKLFVVMRETLNVAYSLSWICLLSVPLLVFTQALNIGNYLSDNLIVIGANLIALPGLWYLTHQNVATLTLLKRKYLNQNIQHWVFHVAVSLVYIGSLNMIFTAWSVGTSIALLIHAVIVLFLTLSDKYKGLLRLSIVLYVATAIKVLLHDMGDFGNLHKVIALMCIGSILMIAAFFFQKLRNKQLA